MLSQRGPLERPVDAVASGATDDKAIGLAVQLRLVFRLPWRQTEGFLRFLFESKRHLRRIEKVGRAQWRREFGQDQQAKGENAIGRFKRIAGLAMRARCRDGQGAEVVLGVSRHPKWHNSPQCAKGHVWRDNTLQGVSDAKSPKNSQLKTSSGKFARSR